MLTNASNWLILAGSLSIIVGIAHIAMIFVGAPAYRYFGAGEPMAKMAEDGSKFPGILTFCMALIFMLWGFYGFSGAGIIRPLPLQSTALSIIAAIYTLRGLGFIVQISMRMKAQTVPTRDLVFSLISLLIGSAFLIGTFLLR